MTMNPATGDEENSGPTDLTPHHGFNGYGVIAAAIENGLMAAMTGEQWKIFCAIARQLNPDDPKYAQPFRSQRDLEDDCGLCNETVRRHLGILLSAAVFSPTGSKSKDGSPRLFVADVRKPAIISTAAAHLLRLNQGRKRKGNSTALRKARMDTSALSDGGWAGNQPALLDRSAAPYRIGRQRPIRQDASVLSHRSEQIQEQRQGTYTGTETPLPPPAGAWGERDSMPVSETGTSPSMTSAVITIYAAMDSTVSNSPASTPQPANQIAPSREKDGNAIKTTVDTTPSANVRLEAEPGPDGTPTKAKPAGDPICIDALSPVPDDQKDLDVDDLDVDGLLPEADAFSAMWNDCGTVSASTPPVALRPLPAPQKLSQEEFDRICDAFKAEQAAGR